MLSERLIDERFDLELVCRFIVLHNRPLEKLTLTLLRDLPQLLDNEMVAFASGFPTEAQALEDTFLRTFEAINRYGGDKIFTKWDAVRSEFRGSFLNTSFEVFALGIGFHIAQGTPYRVDILAAVKEFWGRPGMQSGYATGRSTEARLVKFIPIGREITAD